VLGICDLTVPPDLRVDPDDRHGRCRFTAVTKLFGEGLARFHADQAGSRSRAFVWAGGRPPTARYFRSPGTRDVVRIGRSRATHAGDPRVEGPVLDRAGVFAAGHRPVRQAESVRLGPVATARVPEARLGQHDRASRSYRRPQCVGADWLKWGGFTPCPAGELNDRDHL
jgi:hypothetical protein